MLSWSSMWSAFGFFALISMIWIAGPALQIGDYRPLEPLWARVLLTTLIVLIFLGIYIYKWYKNKKLNEHVIEELKASEVDEPAKEAKDSHIKEQFTNIDLLLQKNEQQKSNNFVERLFADKDEYIYQKPWFLVVGAPGVGKTSAILNAGLTFPIGFDEDNASKLAGTRDCDWFLTDESLLLDTAGRFITQDDSISNSADWNELLELLKRCRTKQPINGLVLMISVDDIISGNDEKIKGQLQQIRLRLQELQSSFNTSFPLHIIVNKIDLISGFTQYFNLIDEKERKKALGIQLDPMTVTSAEKINKLFSELDLKVDEIRDNLFASVAFNNQENDSSDLAISFASEFAIFNRSLKTYLKRLLNLSKYDSDINLAGVYFTSATQQLLGKSLTDSSDFYGLQSKYADNAGSTLVSKSQPYFLNQFFENFLLNTANLAGTDNAWIKKRRKIYWLLMAVIAILFFTCCYLLAKAYAKNDDYLAAVSSQLEILESDLEAKPVSNILELLGYSNRVYKLPSHNINKKLLKASFIKNVGLYQYDYVETAAHSKYQSLIDENFIPSVSITIEKELRRSTNSNLYGSTYKNLKAYLMLYQTKYYDKDFIGQWVIENLEPSNINEDSLDILKQMLSSQQILPNSSIDNELVAKARAILANEDIADTIFNSIEDSAARANTESMPKVSFVSMGGPSTQNVFRRNSDRTLNDPVPTLYSKYGYENIFKPVLSSKIKDFYQKDKWVLGDNIFIRPEGDVIADVYQRYANNYISTWRAYLSDITMVQPKSLQQTVNMAKQLSEKNSSLAGIIKGISENTNLMPASTPTASDATQESSNNNTQSTNPQSAAVERLPVAATVKSGAKNTKGIDDTRYQGYLQDIANNFSQFQTLTQESAESGSQLNDIIGSINDLYVYSIALQRSIQNNDELLPDDKPLINYQAQISRLPDPFEPILDTLQFEVSKARSSYINNKEQQELERQEGEAVETARLQDEMVIEDAEMRRQFILQTAVEQDKIIQSSCKNTIAGRYPFNNTNKDVSLDEFTQLFAQKSGFIQVLDGNIAVVNQNGMTLFTSLLDSGQLDTDSSKRQPTYLQAKKLNNMYLSGTNTPYLGISMKVVAMGKNIEDLNISYDGQDIDYYHGPRKDYLLSWPAKKNSQFRIKTTSSKSKPAILDVKGDWSIFRLLDKANSVTKTKDGKGVLAVFMIDKNKVEIEFKSISGLNPFNLATFRNFKC